MIFLFFSSSLACLEPELELFEVWEIDVRQIIIIAIGINSQTPKLEKTRLSHQVWSHGGSTFKKKRTFNGHFSRPAETDPYGLTNSSIFVHSANLGPMRAHVHREAYLNMA